MVVHGDFAEWNRAFRVGMVAAEMADGLITGGYDLAMIERQLSRTATAAP
jgi:hypothetical protein